MLKTLAYLLVLALLGFGIYFFILRKNDTPFGTTEAGFNIKDTGSVGKLFLATATGESVTVERKADGWWLNGQYKALNGTVNMVLSTLATQVALYPVTKAAYDNAVKTLATDAIKVEVYNREGKKIVVFYVGAASAGGTGTNMLLDGAKQPFVVQTPNFTGDLRPRYTTNFKDWRDRTVFNIPAPEIKSVSVQYVTKPINSFVITRENNSFTVTGDPAITKNLDTLNTGRATRYMNYFTNVNCEGYLNGLEDIDSIMKMSPKRAAIDVETMHGVKQHVDVFWMPINKRSKNKVVANDEVPDEFDADRMFAVINNNKDTIQIQMLTFNKILRRCFEFYQKDVAREMPRPTNVLIHKSN